MQKLEYLNGLRGLAALIVVLHHFAYSFLVFSTKGIAPIHYEFERWVYATPLQLLVAGNFAVCIFFVLSGFVLSYAFFSTGQTRVVRSAAVKRYFRLMPPVLASVVISWLLLTLGWHAHHQAAAISGAPWLDNFWPRAVSIGEALYYGAYGILLGGASPGLLNNALWTMRVELLGSMLVFATLAIVGRLRWRWLAYAALMVATWQTYYVAFVIGIVLCDLASQPRKRPSLPWPVGAALGALGLWLGAAPIPGPEATPYDSLPGVSADPQQAFIFMHIIGAAMVLVTLVGSPLAQRFFGSRPLSYLGKISFSIYLLHVLVLGSVGSYIFVTVYPVHGYATALAWAGTGYLVVCLLAADIFTRYVDGPTIRFASWLGRKIVAPKPAPVVAASDIIDDRVRFSPDARIAQLSRSKAHATDT